MRAKLFGALASAALAGAANAQELKVGDMIPIPAGTQLIVKSNAVNDSSITFRYGHKCRSGVGGKLEIIISVEDDVGLAYVGSGPDLTTCGNHMLTSMTRGQLLKLLTAGK